MNNELRMAKEVAMADIEKELGEDIIEMNDREELVTDFISIAGFSEEDAITASANVLEYDRQFLY